jgi:hypothetical protein
MKKIESLKQLENLFVSLNAEIESSNGFKSYTLDSKNFKAINTNLSKMNEKKKVKKGKYD